jgi:hypothetical protein
MKVSRFSTPQSMTVSMSTGRVTGHPSAFSLPLLLPYRLRPVYFDLSEFPKGGSSRFLT